MSLARSLSDPRAGGILTPMNHEDRYEGLGYRQMIAWSSRLQREWPLFAELFADAPARTVLDLGCGPGEHCARFAAEGWTPTGVDVSRSQVGTAREYHPALEFVQADLGDFESKVSGGFGVALCIGNVLPNLDDATFSAMLGQLARLVLPDGYLLFQQLEFGPILSGKRRSIGPIFQPADDTGPESAFLRIFCPSEDLRRVDFLPVRIRLEPGGDAPAWLDRVERIPWRARRRSEVEEAVAAAGFAVQAVFGGPDKSAHDPESSSDLWVLARRLP